MRPTHDLLPQDGTAACDSGPVTPADLGRAAVAPGRVSPFLLWQLADSALPTGGFAHSSGLEAAHQCGEVRHRRDLDGWLRASLTQLTAAALPFVNALHTAPGTLADVDALCDAFTSNHVANRASRAQGRALLSLARRAFPGIRPPAPFAEPPHGHFAPVFGWVTVQLGLDASTARELFVFQFLRSALAAAVRLNLIGPMEAQAVQLQLHSAAQHAVDAATPLTLEDLAQTAPIPDLLQGAQDRLYSRLFQS